MPALLRQKISMTAAPLLPILADATQLERSDVKKNKDDVEVWKKKYFALEA